VKNQLVVVPSPEEPIKPSPGFAKKLLSGYKLDLLALCGFGCSYCSSNTGNYLRINRERFADLTEQQLGVRTYPAEDPALSFVWPDVVEHLSRQVGRKGKAWGAGETLMFSMLTDGFSPTLVKDGTTEAALKLVLERTSFRIRVLTKNAVAGSSEWIEFWKRYGDRVVVGLSTGTTDDAWARKVEVGASLPSARLRALRNLQDAGIPTFGMLCPVFPDVLAENRLEELLAAIRPERCEHVWAEPYNDRVNWEAVRAGYAPSSASYEWFTRVFGAGDTAEWSRYATDLYLRLASRAEREGWPAKLRYLLYEHRIAATHATAYEETGLAGVLLQGKPTADGLSANPHVAAAQQRLAAGRRGKPAPIDWSRLLGAVAAS
jgi:DNA repair photolyase